MLRLTVAGTGLVRTVPLTGVHFWPRSQMLMTSTELPPVMDAGEKPISPVTTAQLTRPVPTTSGGGVPVVLGGATDAPAMPVDPASAARPTARLTAPNSRRCRRRPGGRGGPAR